MYGSLFGFKYVTYHFGVIVTLTYDLVSRIIMPGAYLLYFLRKESHIWCVDSSWDGGVVHIILGNFDLDIDFGPHF